MTSAILFVAAGPQVRGSTGPVISKWTGKLECLLRVIIQVAIPQPTETAGRMPGNAIPVAFADFNKIERGVNYSSRSFWSTAIPTTRSPSSRRITLTPRVLRFWIEISLTFIRMTTPDALIAMI